MKISRTYSLEQSLVTEFEAVAVLRKTNRNALLEHCMRTLLKESRKTDFVKVTCKECAYEYPEHFGECPKCFDRRQIDALEISKKRAEEDRQKERVKVAENIAALEIQCNDYRRYIASGQTQSGEIKRLSQLEEALKLEKEKLDNLGE